MLRRITSVLVILSICLSLAACGSKDTPTTDSGRIPITLACWIEDLELDWLVSEFNDSQTEYEIQIKSYYSDDESYESAISRMNIELITGKHPDLFYLDGMDVMALASANLLADLYTFMENDDSFDSDDYLMDKVALYETGGKLYELPLAFWLFGLYGPQTLLGDRKSWTIEEFKELEASMEEDECLFGSTQSNMLGSMTQYSLNEFVDGENASCNFDSDEFKEWLEFVASFPENATLYAGILMPGMLDSVIKYAQDKISLNGLPTYVGYPSNHASGLCVRSYFSFGVYSNTQYPEVCWDFIKSLLTEDNQGQLVSNFGFPICKAVLEDQITRATLDKTDPNFLFSGWGSKYEPLTDEEANYLRDLIYNAKDVRFRYDAVTDIIHEEAAPFFAGQQTVDATAKQIQSRVNLYLSEHEKLS